MTRLFWTIIYTIISGVVSINAFNHMYRTNSVSHIFIPTLFSRRYSILKPNMLATNTNKESIDHSIDSIEDDPMDHGELAWDVILPPNHENNSSSNNIPKSTLFATALSVVPHVRVGTNKPTTHNPTIEFLKMYWQRLMHQSMPLYMYDGQLLNMSQLFPTHKSFTEDPVQIIFLFL